MAFLQGLKDCKLVRVFRLTSFLNQGCKAMIVTDASPYGIGGFYIIDGIIIGYFMDSVNPDDLTRLGVVDAEKGQQCWEALSILVALRIWHQLWAEGRLTLAVKSDNMTALTLVNTLKAKGGGLRIIACEMALTMSRASFEPDLTIHTPGVCNDVADTLSRRFDPARSDRWQLPRALEHAQACTPPVRDDGWWEYLQWQL